MKIPTNFKNIYVQALLISAVTFLIAYLIYFLSPENAGGLCLWLAFALTWPWEIFAQINYHIFDLKLLESSGDYTLYFFNFLIQYFGYLGLLFGIRLYRKRNNQQILKNIYFQALLISVGTLILGLIFADMLFNDTDNSLLLGIITVLLYWPTTILSFVITFFEGQFFGSSQFNFNFPFFLFIHYLGYLALLFGVRNVRKKKAARE